MAEVDFDNMLDMDLDAIHRPPPLPVGTYRVLVEDKQYVKSAKKGTDGCEFTFSNWEPQDDVDKEELEEYLAQPGSNLQSYKRSGNDTTFWMTPKTLWRLKEFIEKCGVSAQGPLGKALEECKGQNVLCFLDQTPGRDGGVFNEIKSFTEA